jgi:hypothetical protein
VLDFAEWKIVSKVIEDYGPDSVSPVKFDRFSTNWLPSYHDRGRRVFKQTLMTLKRKDESAKIILETVEVENKEVERAIYLEKTSLEKTPISVKEKR